MVEVLVGLLIGGLITWWVAHAYFRKQDRRAEQIFEAQAHFLESLAGVVTKVGEASIVFTRDAKGRIMGATASRTVVAKDGVSVSESATAKVTRAR